MPSHLPAVSFCDVRRLGHVLLLFLSAGSQGLSQNLVPNPGFEAYAFCPGGPQGVCMDFVPPWFCPNTATSDLFNSCGGPTSQWSVPNNAFGTQAAHGGEGYAGILVRWLTAQYREYVSVPLAQPLEAGTWYHVYFYVSLSESSCGAIEQIGAHFSSQPIAQANWNWIDAEPQVESDFGFLSDRDGWTLISGCFEAEGGEAYLTIGNFHPDAETPMDPPCPMSHSYYYIDDVVVEAGQPPTELAIDLGDDAFSCDPFEIDPGHDGPYFLWSDGSTGPTLTVTETGMYALTVHDGCNSGADSVFITIGGQQPPVELGPASLELCTGAPYSFALDPSVSTYTWSDGTEGPSFTITTAGTYGVTLDDGCAASSDEVVVTLMEPPPPFSLGDDFELCAGDEVEISIDPSLGDPVWHDGSTSYLYLVTGGGTYSVTVSNMCGSSSDEIVVTSLDVPHVQLGPEAETFCAGETLVLEIDPDLGDIAWQDGSSVSQYVVTATGTYAVSVTNACGTGTDQVEVTFLDEPQANLGPDRSACPGDTIILVADQPGSTHIWQDQSSGPTLMVTTPGMYAVTVTNPCGTDADSVQVAFASPLAMPDLGPDTSLCAGEQLTLQAGNPGATILWQDMSTADTLLVSLPGVYTVQVTNGCDILNDTVVVDVTNEPPAVDLPDAVTLCQGQSILLDGGSFPGAYLWSNGSQLQQLAVTTPGMYGLTVTTPCGTGSDSVTVLDGGPAPHVDLGPDVALCPGDTLTLMPASSQVDTWLWPDGSTLPTFDLAGGGEVIVAVGNSCGSASDTILVGLLPDVPLVDLGPDTALCPGEGLELTVSLPDVTIQWPDGSGNPTYLVDAPGDIVVVVNNTCGTSTDTIGIDGLPGIPVLDLGPDPSLCPGETYTIDPGIPDVSYTWHDGSTGTIYTTTQPGLIALTIRNRCGSSTDTLQVIESTEGPRVDLGPDRQACAGETVTLSAGISGVNYLWQDGSTGPGYTAVESGTYILQVSNNCGSDTDTVVVDISGKAPEPDLGPDTTICAGAALVLTATADAGTTIFWQDGSTGPTYAVTQAGHYILTATNRCGSGADTVAVALADKPAAFTLGPDTVLCPGQTLLLTSPSIEDSITWQDGSHEEQFVVDQPGTYSLMLENACGSTSDQITITYDARVPVVDLGPSVERCPDEVITLDATQAFNAAYAWSTGAITPAIEVNAPGTYTVEVTAPCGQASGTIDVTPAEDCLGHGDIYVPNVFSPNGDGINDRFVVTVGEGIEVVGIRGKIYDRWGNVVFASSDLPFLWDGRYRGEAVQPGVCVYLIELAYRDAGGQHQRVLAGDVTLIR